jgi:hypothetical protein
MPNKAIQYQIDARASRERGERISMAARVFEALAREPKAMTASDLDDRPRDRVSPKEISDGED